MTKNWVKYILGLALLINVVALGFWFFKPSKSPLNPHEVLINALNLDDAQRQKLEVLKLRDIAARDSFSKEMTNRRRVLYSNFTTKNATQIDSATAEIAQVFQKLEKSNYEHFAAIRALCRPEQQAQFDTLIFESVRLLERKKLKVPPRFRQ